MSKTDFFYLIILIELTALVPSRTRNYSNDIYFEIVADKIHDWHRAGPDHKLQQKRQVRRREDRAHLPGPLRPCLLIAAQSVLSQKLSVGGRLDGPHLVRGDQGRLHYVDQVS